MKMTGKKKRTSKSKSSTNASARKAKSRAPARRGKTGEGRRKAMACVEAARDKKAHDCTMLDMRKISSIADYFVICSGDSNRQVKAIAESILLTLKKNGVRCWHSEGWTESLWIVLDFGDVIVHVFQDEVRKFYRLERLWGDAGKTDSP